MAESPARDILVEGTWNARVFGNGRPWLVRSAALDRLTGHGRRTLDRLGARTAVDLRERAERGVAGHGLAVTRVPVYGRFGAPDARLGLEACYHQVVDHCGDALAAAVGAVADADGVAVVHGADGKDRTGLVVALALLAAGHTREEVVADYALSARRQPAFLRRQVVDQMAWDGLEAATPAGREHLRRRLESPPEAMARVLDFLELGGGWRAYLLDHGLGEGRLEAIRAKAGVVAPARVERVPALV
jgi:hypothetical protein